MYFDMTAIAPPAHMTPCGPACPHCRSRNVMDDMVETAQGWLPTYRCASCGWNGDTVWWKNHTRPDAEALHPDRGPNAYHCQSREAFVLRRVKMRQLQKAGLNSREVEERMGYWSWE